MASDLQYLFDILEAARLATAYLDGKTLAEFIADSVLKDAVVRRIEVLGEAASRVSAVTKDRYHELPWREMTGMRNVVVHEYGAIDYAIVWDTVKNDLPALVAALEGIVPPPEA